VSGSANLPARLAQDCNVAGVVAESWSSFSAANGVLLPSPPPQADSVAAAAAVRPA